jgi:hypothetical protein
MRITSSSHRYMPQRPLLFPSAAAVAVSRKLRLSSRVVSVARHNHDRTRRDRSFSLCLGRILKKVDRFRASRRKCQRSSMHASLQNSDTLVAVGKIHFFSPLAIPSPGISWCHIPVCHIHFPSSPFFKASPLYSASSCGLGKFRAGTGAYLSTNKHGADPHSGVQHQRYRCRPLGYITI